MKLSSSSDFHELFIFCLLTRCSFDAHVAIFSLHPSVLLSWSWSSNFDDEYLRCSLFSIYAVTTEYPKKFEPDTYGPTTDLKLTLLNFCILQFDAKFTSFCLLPRRFFSHLKNLLRLCVYLRRKSKIFVFFKLIPGKIFILLLHCKSMFSVRRITIFSLHSSERWSHSHEIYSTLLTRKIPFIVEILFILLSSLELVVFLSLWSV